MRCNFNVLGCVYYDPVVIRTNYLMKIWVTCFDFFLGKNIIRPKSSSTIIYFLYSVLEIDNKKYYKKSIIYIYIDIYTLKYLYVLFI